MASERASGVLMVFLPLLVFQVAHVTNVAAGAQAPLADGAEARLIEAVKERDVVAVRALVDQSVDVNAPEPDGTTALHWATYLDDSEITDLLIRAGAQVTAVNSYGATPIWLASSNGNSAVVETLLREGADPNTAMPEEGTVLMAAARTGSVAAVEALLDFGAEASAREDSRGQSALMWAAAEGHVDVIRALVDHGADIHARSKAEFRPSEAQFRQTDEPYGAFTALLFAAREGKTAAVHALLEAGADVDDTLRPTDSEGEEPETGFNAFLLAVENAHFELAASLLDWGVDPNTAPLGWTALHQVSWVRKTGDSGHTAPAPEGSGNMGSLEFVRHLVEHGADVNSRAASTRPPAGGSLNMLGATPFLMAARTKDAEYMRLLSALGADPLLPNDDNTTPLMVAAGVGANVLDGIETEGEFLAAVEVALELGNDVNAVDNNGETAMHGAAYTLLPFVAQFLSENGARIEVWNQPNSDGATPLDIATGSLSTVSSAATTAAFRELLGQAEDSTADGPEADR